MAADGTCDSDCTDKTKDLDCEKESTSLNYLIIIGVTTILLIGITIYKVKSKSKK